MYFIETVIYNGKTYCLKGNRVVIDQSFAHAFGIERGYSYEVDNLEIFEAFDENGKEVRNVSIGYSNGQADEIIEGTQLQFEQLNEYYNSQY